MTELQETRKQLGVEQAQLTAARHRLDRLLAQIAEAEHELETVEESGLAAAGVALAGLQAQVERQRAVVSEAESAYNARIALIGELEQRAEYELERERVRAGVEQVTAAWESWQAEYLALDARARMLWGWFRSLQDASLRLSVQADNYGLDGPPILPKQQRVGIVMVPSEAVVQASRTSPLSWNPSVGIVDPLALPARERLQHVSPWPTVPPKE